MIQAHRPDIVSNVPLKLYQKPKNVRYLYRAQANILTRSQVKNQKLLDESLKQDLKENSNAVKKKDVVDTSDEDGPLEQKTTVASTSEGADVGVEEKAPQEEAQDVTAGSKKRRLEETKSESDVAAPPTKRTPHFSTEHRGQKFAARLW